MAYGVKFRPHEVDTCRIEAERRAGPCDLGYLYRLSDVGYSISDEYGDHAYTDTCVELDAYPIHKVTPCGHTLEHYSGARRRFVSSQTDKRFALPTIEDAVENFIRRKTRQAQIYERRANTARRCIEMVTDLLLSPTFARA